MKCPKCRRRKFTEEDEKYLENTGRCKVCDLRIHKEDMSEQYWKLKQTKPSIKEIGWYHKPNNAQ